VPTVVLATESREPSGVGSHMLELARRLSRRGAGTHVPEFDVVVAAPDGPDARWLLDAADRAGVATWRLPDDEPSVQARVLERLLRDASPDLLHIHAGIDWEGHDFAHGARAARIPALVRTEHLPFLITTEWQAADYRAALPLHDALICVSEGVARTHRAAGVPGDLIRVVRNGISPVPPTRSRAEVRRMFDIAEDAPLAVTVGRLTEQKGYDTLLAAVPSIRAAVPDARFVWVGAGPLEDRLRAGIEDANLGGVIRLVPASDDVPALLAASDLVISPSRFEGLPLVALEAMAVGRPIVATRVVGLDETVVDDMTGRLVPQRDVAALAAAVIDLLTDRELAGRMGAAGRERQASEFGADRMAREVGAIYDEVLQRAARNASVDADERRGMPTDDELTAVARR
jgi:glycosyltransferase involved in cell wall biosynthesis